MTIGQIVISKKRKRILIVACMVLGLAYQLWSVFDSRRERVLCISDFCLPVCSMSHTFDPIRGNKGRPTAVEIKSELLGKDENCFVKILHADDDQPILFRFENRNSSVSSFAQILWNFKSLGSTSGSLSASGSRMEELNSFFLNREEDKWRLAAQPSSINEDDSTDQWDSPKPDHRSPWGKFILLELYRRDFNDFSIHIDTCLGENKSYFAQMSLC